MLGLNDTNPPAQPTDMIVDGTDATFMADVVEASQTRPVIVDFWAPWCGPCKTLGPMIEGAVKKAKGAVKLVKIDIDQNPGYAQQLQVQSIPTVYAFFQGRPVDAFQGALPQSQIEAFVGKLAELAGGAADGGLGDAVAAAEEMLEEGAVTDAVQTFAAILEEDPEHAGAFAGLVRAYVALGDLDQAEAILNGAPEAIAKAPELDAAHAKIQLARQAANAGPVAELRQRVEADPQDHQARFDLATALQASGDTQGAVDELLELFRRDREWNDGAAKTQLFTIFDSLPGKDPIVLAGRRKLSSMIFA